MKLSGSTKKLLIRIVLFLLYLVIGAGIFVAIETHGEQDERRKAEEFIEEVENLTKYFNSSEKVTKFLLDFKHALRYGYNIKSNDFDPPKWSYMNSFYFVGNIVTTIGK
ncbi:Potassium channel subfamily K member 13 [Paramuricea clavata]|uniref:Potassium channel subfamily K member 13 n=1 Tax=Paramuricea clavata TaxID=317549 RepID=A0A6S7H334_PARCT|nr:Potassium channel subfamily K member 13 [Paramuricea clavata]